MVRRKGKAGRRTTIYRLTSVFDFEDAIRDKYLEHPSFTQHHATVGERPSLLVTGAMVKEQADWCSTVSTLTGEIVDVGGVTPAGVLLIRPGGNDALQDGIAYALSYGMGFQLLEPGRMDNLFGQRIAIRTADPLKLRSLTVTTMDERSRVSRATIPQGDGLLGFGVGDVGEAVSRIVAVAHLPTLSRSGGEPLQIRGSDALNVPLGHTSAEVLADLDVLERLLTSEPHPSLKLLEQLAAVKNPETKATLDGRLSTALGNLENSDGSLGIAWPHERIDENGTPDSWIPQRLWPGRNNMVRSGQPDWLEIRSALEKWPPGARLSRVESASIQLCRDAEGSEPISQAISLRRWIAFETDLDDRTYALYDGSWYEIHYDYAGNITQRTKELFGRAVDDLRIRDWRCTEDEEAYNKALASDLGGVCLDRKLITTDLHRRGIEACDVYLSDGTLIHVKKTEKSAAASHLLAQALVSADALCNDAQARKELRSRIKSLGGDPSKILHKPTRVILAMYGGNRKPVTPENLFTFTKVNLVRQAALLEERGVSVRVVAINSADAQVE